MEKSTETQFIDLSCLSKWVQPQHLTHYAIESYYSSYLKNDNIVRVPNFLTNEVANYLYNYLNFEGEYEKIYGLCKPDEQVAENVWLESDDQNRMYRFSQLRGTKSDVRSLNPLLFARFRDSFCDTQFLPFFEGVTGLKLAPLNSFAGNAYGVGDFLRAHHDAAGKRRIAYIIYLNPYWQSNYGGALHFFNHKNEESIYEFEHNCLALFDVKGHKEHFVSEITEAAGEHKRISIGGWFDDPIA